jgi:hypothetical protein
MVAFSLERNIPTNGHMVWEKLIRNVPKTYPGVLHSLRWETFTQSSACSWHSHPGVRACISKLSVQNSQFMVYFRTPTTLSVFEHDGVRAQNCHEYTKPQPFIWLQQINKVIRKVRRLGAENCQFRHNRASMLKWEWNFTKWNNWDPN